MEIDFNCRINVRTEYQRNTEMLLYLFVLFQYAHLTSQTVQCTVGLIFTASTKEAHIRICMCHLLFWFGFCELLLCYFRLCTYVNVPHYIWSFERACVFPPPRLCVSAHMGSFMSQQPRHSLKVTNHFLKWGTSS